MPLWLVLLLAASAPRLKAAPSLVPGLEPPSAAVPWSGGRVYTSATLHVGVRTHALVTPDEVGAAATLQVSFAAP